MSCVVEWHVLANCIHRQFLRWAKRVDWIEWHVLLKCAKLFAVLRIYACSLCNTICTNYLQCRESVRWVTCTAACSKLLQSWKSMLQWRSDHASVTSRYCNVQNYVGAERSCFSYAMTTLSWRKSIWVPFQIHVNFHISLTQNLECNTWICNTFCNTVHVFVFR